MTKAEVIAEIVEKTSLAKEDVQFIVETFFKVIQKAMENGENIYVRGFGSFVNKKRARKIARNISQNTALVIDAHYIPSFKPAKTFVSRIKNSEALRLRLRQEEENNPPDLSDSSKDQATDAS
ncbi:MAG: integration host factor subunit beta [Microscillaceae bacterium]|nr:integration host factor subunit beta [Microscillaceae bacterium]